MVKQLWLINFYIKLVRFTGHQVVSERVMDSGDIEKERGITILAKKYCLKL